MAPFLFLAKVSSFTCEVIVQSGERIAPLQAAEYLLNDGDLVQTKEGEAEILFNDGATLKLNPYSNAMIQERTEESGFWIFKTKQEARRITCMLGKLFFQSGVSGKRNYLQTPTAVAPATAAATTTILTTIRTTTTTSSTTTVRYPSR